jgi:hypothetical protein
MSKPSPRYIKHGWLSKDEYNPNIHNGRTGITMDERNINPYQPLTTYYTLEEMKKMKEEIKIAECPICYEKIDDERCRLCENGHKFHNKCSPSQDNEVTKCPICMNENITSCNNINTYNDISSGGKVTKRKNKITMRKIFKNRKFVKKNNKKSRMSRKSRKQ